MSLATHVYPLLPPPLLPYLPFLTALFFLLLGLFLNPLGIPLPAFFDVHQRKGLRKATRAYAPPESLPTRHYVVLVNPNAGAGQGRIIYEEVILPMLEKAGQTHDVVWTVGPGHATEVCAAVAAGRLRGVRSGTGKIRSTATTTVTLAPPDCVISASGDGMLHECLNGLLAPAAGRATRASSPARSGAGCPVPLAVVPVGSGNGVSDSLYGRGCGPHAALAKIIAGKPKPADVMAVRYDGEEAVA
jgi:sphingosine kinase